MCWVMQVSPTSVPAALGSAQHNKVHVSLFAPTRISRHYLQRAPHGFHVSITCLLFYMLVMFSVVSQILFLCNAKHIIHPT